MMIAHYYRKFIQGIGNLIYYFKVIWSDRQWDYEFFYCLELKKVQKMIRWWSSGDNVTSEKNVLRDLHICEHLLKVLSGEVDHMEVTSTHPINFRFTRYVNLKNMGRFISLGQDVFSKEWNKQELYELKCKNLYYTIRDHRMNTWWD